MLHTTHARARARAKYNEERNLNYRRRAERILFPIYKQEFNNGQVRPPELILSSRFQEFRQSRDEIGSRRARNRATRIIFARTHRAFDESGWAIARIWNSAMWLKSPATVEENRFRSRSGMMMSYTGDVQLVGTATWRCPKSHKSISCRP